MKKTLLSVISAGIICLANAQVYDTAHVTIPGTLNKVAKACLTTVTNLTITGQIDARDFKTMRDSMTMLSVLNLSNDTIVEYTGTLGTFAGNNYTYPANTIPQYAFCNSQKGTSKTTLKSIIFPNNITAIGQLAFEFCYGLNDSLKIPASVTVIGEEAFYYCYNLTGSLVIPSQATYIGDYAFSTCGGFTGTVNIPSTVLYIGTGAFYSCNGITGYNIDNSNPLFCSINGVIFNKSKTTLIVYPGGLKGNYSIPLSVDTISDYAFCYCNNLSGSLIIPNSVIYIGNDAFYECSGITGSLVISPSVKTIGWNAFTVCSGLTGTLTIPPSVTSIGNNAFRLCDKLSGVTIPLSVNYIGSYAFQGCTGLKSIVDLNPVPLTGISIGTDVFENDTAGTLYVPCGSINAYTSAPVWDSIKITSNPMFVPISASGDTVKTGTSVTFTADTECINNPVSLQWKVNSINQGTGKSIYSYIPVNGDSVKCIATINDSVITSNSIVMNVTASGNKINSVTATSSYLYPNPNDGNFTIGFSNPDNQIIQIIITDIKGITVFETSTTQNTFICTGNKLQSGIYFVMVKGDANFNVSKMEVR